jgi:LysM repeat protein
MREHRAMRKRFLLPLAAVVVLAAPAVASADYPHVVTPGESLSSVAAVDGLSVDQVAAANGIPSDGQLIAGTTLLIPPQTSATGGSAAATAGTAASTGDGDADSDDGAAGSATPVSVSSAPASAGAYVVQPGDTLSAIAANAGTSVSELATANGIDPNALLLAGSTLHLAGSPATSSAASQPASATTQAPAIGTSIVGRMTWFGGPHDAGAQGAPASGLGWRSDGMSFYNYGSLGHRWLIRFPWGQTLNMSQIDIGPAPWTGNPFDIAFSALPNTPYNWQNWPNPVVTGTYQGGSP